VQTVEQVNRRIAKGWQFIVIGSELRFMTLEAQSMVKSLNRATAKDIARY